MLRVRNVDCLRADPVPPTGPSPSTMVKSVSRGRSGGLRLVAMAGLGLALGAGGTILTVSLVQADDDAGIRAFHREEAARRAEHVPTRAAFASVTASAYAPARQTWSLPFFQQPRPDGRLAPPPVELNPFKPVRERKQAQHKPKRPTMRYDTVSGAANATRTICVRLCDGFHAPIGHLRSQSDLKAHEALCQAANPGVPVKVFKVLAGAATIDDAVASDGKAYRALPMAYAYERGADPACRPAIVAAGERRVSLLRDFTLRPGDSVVLDGRVRTFSGGKWPYTTADFRDFRGSRELTARDRRQIDAKVGISHAEAQVRALRRKMRVREASLRDESYASDADPLGLRGLLGPRDPIANPPRVVLPTPFSRNRVP